MSLEIQTKTKIQDFEDWLDRLHGRNMLEVQTSELSRVFRISAAQCMTLDLGCEIRK